jgi:hypothetical protein
MGSSAGSAGTGFTGGCRSARLSGAGTLGERAADFRPALRGSSRRPRPLGGRRRATPDLRRHSWRRARQRRSPAGSGGAFGRRNGAPSPVFDSAGEPRRDPPRHQEFRARRRFESKFSGALVRRRPSARLLPGFGAPVGTGDAAARGDRRAAGRSERRRGARAPGLRELRRTSGGLGRVGRGRQRVAGAGGPGLPHPGLVRRLDGDRSWPAGPHARAAARPAGRFSSTGGRRARGCLPGGAARPARTAACVTNKVVLLDRWVGAVLL